MQPDVGLVDKFLVANPRTKKVTVAMPKHRKATMAELDFFENLKARYQSLGISLDIGMPDLARSRGRGLELSL